MKKVLNNTPNPPTPISLSLFRRNIVGFHPIRQGGFVWTSAPRAIVRCRPRFRPRTAVANDIFHSQVVFVQLCLFAGTAVARGANDHLVLAPFYPRRIAPESPTRHIVFPPMVACKYRIDTGTFSPIGPQCSWAVVREVIDYRHDFSRNVHIVVRVRLWSRETYLFRKRRKSFQFL